jgi:signal transduction histidine kinase
MLHALLVENGSRLVELARKRRNRERSVRSVSPSFDAVPGFLAHLADALAPTASTHELRVVLASTSVKIREEAARQGRALERSGCSVAQLVAWYGGISRAVTDLAKELHTSVSSDDLQLLNQCLDDAIASAVTAHCLQHERVLACEDLYRRQMLAHELTNLLNVAMVSFENVSDSLAPGGEASAAIHAHSLAELRALVSRSADDAKLGTQLAPRLERIIVAELVAELAPGARMQAGERGLRLIVMPPSDDVAIAGDRHLLTSAIWSLLQNAFQLTRARGEVLLRVTATLARVNLDVCDQCGGLPAAKAERLLQLLEGPRHHGNARDGLGLAIALGAAHAHLGDLRVRDVPGEGCVFTLDLPRHQLGAPPPQLAEAVARR